MQKGLRTGPAVSCSSVEGSGGVRRPDPSLVRTAYDKRRLPGDLALYAVTDSRWLAGRALEDVVGAAIDGGATFVQLREKAATHEGRCALARRVLGVCRAHGVPFVVDDDVACALEVGADGVHVGQEDTAAREARRMLGPDAIVGVSAQTVEQALKAVEDGADYLGVGAVFPTGTKGDAADVGLSGLARICAAVDVPVVAIGGISADNVGSLAGSGARGVAVVSAIFAAPDPREAARGLRRAVGGWDGPR